MIGYFLFAVPLWIVMANCCRPAAQRYEEADSAPLRDAQAGLLSCLSRVKSHRDIRAFLAFTLVTNPAISALCTLVRPILPYPTLSVAASTPISLFLQVQGMFCFSCLIDPLYPLSFLAVFLLLVIAINLAGRATRLVVWGELTPEELTLILKAATETHDPPLLGRFLHLKPVEYPSPHVKTMWPTYGITP
jgi:hypothetical protein